MLFKCESQGGSAELAHQVWHGISEPSFLTPEVAGKVERSAPALR